MSDLEQSGAPVIVYERADQSGVQDDVAIRELLHRPRARLWLKQTTLRDYRLNNEPLYLGYWHLAQLLRYPALGLDELPESDRRLAASAKPIDASAYAKVRLLPILPMKQFDPFRDLDPLPIGERPIDVQFIGTVDYDYPFLAVHRRAAAMQISRMTEVNSLVGANYGVLRKPLYMKTLRHTKISVSPWGNGEHSWRDYESWMCGCVLVKPDIDHVRAFVPDLYEPNRYHVPCRPDFEDLPEVVDRILGNYDFYHDMAQRARRDLIAANSREVVVEYFLDLFRSVDAEPA